MQMNLAPSFSSTLKSLGFVMEESAAAAVVMEEPAVAVVMEESAAAAVLMEESAAAVVMEESAAAVVMEESAAAVVMEESAAAVVMEESAAAVVMEESAAAVVMEESAAAVVMEESAAAVVMEESAAAGVMEESALAVVMEESAAAVVTEESAAAVVREESAAAVVTEESAAAVVMEKSAAAVVMEESAAAVVMEESAAAVVMEESAAAVVTEESAAAVVTEESAAAVVMEDTAAAVVMEESAAAVVMEESAAAVVMEESAAAVVMEESAAAVVMEESAAAVVMEESAAAVVMEESAAAVVTEESAAAVVTEESAAAVVMEESAAAVVMEESAAAVVMEESAAAVVMEESAAAVVMEESAAAVVMEESAAAVVMEESAAAGVMEESAAAGVMEESAAAVVMEESAAAVVMEESAAAVVMEESAAAVVMQESAAEIMLQSPQVRLSKVGKAVTPVEQYFSSPYFSPRIQSIRSHISEFSSRFDFQVDASKSHWTEISPEAGLCKHPNMWGIMGRELGGFRLPGRRLMSESSDVLAARSVQESRKVFAKLKRARHSFFKDFDNLVLGEKIAEGGQAEIYEGTCSGYNLMDESRPSECVVKVFRRGLDLSLLHSQWPSKLCQKMRNSYTCTGTSEILGSTLLADGRCAFVLQRYWGDLRTLIDNNMLETGNRCPPFQEPVALRILWQIARGMATLHENNILHRDLKASNVLLNMYSDEYPDCYVADYECCIGIVGTKFWRAPEVLQALKNGSLHEATTQCTKMADVYSFGMLCYEVLTGSIPFEEKSGRDYDVVLSGQRPRLPGGYVWTRITAMVRACWNADPWKRPSFKEICNVIESFGNHMRYCNMTDGAFPYYGWRGKEQDVSMVRWQWSSTPFVGSKKFYFVPYTKHAHMEAVGS